MRLHLTEVRRSMADFETVVGVLKGFDQLMNLVLDEVQEYMRGMER